MGETLMRSACRSRIVVAERLALRDKAVAGGLALATAQSLVMMELDTAYLLGLALLAPLLAMPAVRSRVFPLGRETFAAYYVAWLYGPLGWGVYRNIRWAVALGIVTAAIMVARLVGA